MTSRDSLRDLEERLDDLEADRDDAAPDEAPTVTIRHVRADADGELVGVTRVVECGPGGATRVFDEPRPVEEFDDHR